MLSYNRKLITNSRILRSNMTDAERRLWSRIRRKQIGSLTFLRQKIIGDYIVDFYCHDARLMVEIDGSQHQSGIGEQKDITRDKYLIDRGFIILRFNDHDVLQNTDGAVTAILEAVHTQFLNPP
jgi:very-short-patch-repair endonuclease